MKNNIIQTVVTYHSGMVALAYEWGSVNHMAPHDASPDDLVNFDISKDMASYAGDFKDVPMYPTGKFHLMPIPLYACYKHCIFIH